MASSIILFIITSLTENVKITLDVEFYGSSPIVLIASKQRELLTREQGTWWSELFPIYNSTYELIISSLKRKPEKSAFSAINADSTTWSLPDN